MRKLSLHQFFLIFCLLALATSACNLTAPGSSSNNPSSSASRGSGPFDLSDATLGLGDLDSYKASLKTSFTGAASGSESSWSKTYTLSVSKARQARLMSISDDDTTSDMSMDGFTTGQMDGLVYTRMEAANPCSAEFLTADNIPDVVEPARMLPPVAGAEIVSGNETLAGLEVTHYRYNEQAVDMVGIGTAQGEMWVANNGGFVVKYSLQIQSEQSIYDSDLTGTMTWEYALEDVNQAFDIPLPADCPSGMGDVPLPEAAANGEKVPGYLTYTTDQSIAEVADYYQQNLPTVGFQVDGTPVINNNEAHLEFVNGSRTLTIQISSGDQITVTLLMESASNQAVAIPNATPEPAVETTNNLVMRISNALTLLLGSDTTPSVFPSYHLELTGSIPALDTAGEILTRYDDIISADVQGANVHMTETKTPEGEATTVTEGYRIGETNYLVTGGQVLEDIFGIQMIWISWPLDVLSPLGMASMGPEAQGTETINGREADKYALDTAKADPANLEMFKGMLPLNPIINEAHGTIWLDHETGALLKLVLDYSGDFKDVDKNALGSAPGHIEIMVSQVGQVTVSLP